MSRKKTEPKPTVSTHPVMAALERALESGSQCITICWMDPDGDRYCRGTLDVLGTVGLLTLCAADMGCLGVEQGN